MSRLPELRFPGYTEEWREVRLGKICNVIGGGTPDTKNSSYWNGNIPWFTPTEIKKRYCEKSKRTITENGLNNSSAKLLPIGTILLTTRATIGDACVAIKECTTNQGFQNLIAKKAYSNNVFLYYWILTKRYELLKRANGSTFLEISNKEIKRLKIFLPSLSEQQKIADFLTAVDEKIETVEAKIDRLERYKKGMMQKLLSGEVRFPGFTEEWREVKLGEVAERITRKNNIQETNILTISAQKGLIKQEHFFKKSVASKVVSNYFLLQKGDFAYNKSYSNGYPFGAIKRLKLYESGIVSPLYICFRIKKNVIPEFLEYYFDAGGLNQEINKVAQEGARNHGLLNIGISDFFNTKLTLPSKNEQQKIADFLTAIDDKIDTEKARLEALKAYKKGLLQKMFV